MQRVNVQPPDLRPPFIYDGGVVPRISPALTTAAPAHLQLLERRCSPALRPAVNKQNSQKRICELATYSLRNKFIKLHLERCYEH